MSDIESASPGRTVKPNSLLTFGLVFICCGLIASAVLFLYEDGPSGTTYDSWKGEFVRVETTTEAAFYLVWIVGVGGTLLTIVLILAGKCDTKLTASASVAPLDNAGPDLGAVNDDLKAKLAKTESQLAEANKKIAAHEEWKQQDAKSDQANAKELDEWKRKAQMFDKKEEMMQAALKAIKDLDPLLGVRIEENEARGVKAAKIVPGGPADKAGLQVGDVIEELDGREEEKASEFVEHLLKEYDPGNKASLLVKRGDKHTIVVLEVGAKNIEQAELARLHRHAEGKITNEEILAAMKA